MGIISERREGELCSNFFFIKIMAAVMMNTTRREAPNAIYFSLFSPAIVQPRLASI